jgi:hypothetical protein
MVDSPEPRRYTGHSGPPMRLAAPAEITHIVLRSA